MLGGQAFSLGAGDRNGLLGTREISTSVRRRPRGFVVISEEFKMIGTIICYSYVVNHG